MGVMVYANSIKSESVSLFLSSSILRSQSVSFRIGEIRTSFPA